MTEWKPTSLRVSQRWEILKARLDRLSPFELLQVSPDYWFQRFGTAASAVSHKYEGQPRDDRGRWTGGGVEQSPKDRTIVVAARVSRRREAECDAQYKLDIFKCNLVRTPLCWQSANARYAACLAGQERPALRF
jgi:hypothetical protein